MAKKTTTLKDRQGNILYPQTLASVVYTANGNTVDSELSQLEKAKLYLGYFATPEDLPSTGSNGQYANVGSTDTIWVWDTDTSSWKNTDNATSAVLSVNGLTGDVTLTGNNVQATANSETKSVDAHLQTTYDEIKNLWDNKVEIGTTIAGLELSQDITSSELREALNVENGSQKNVQSNWTQEDNTKDDYIKNKPTLGTASYKNVSVDISTGTDIPTADQVRTYVSNNGGKIDSISVNEVTRPITNKNVNIVVPTKTSDITNDSNYITDSEVDTKLEEYVSLDDVEQEVNDSNNPVASSAVKTSIGNCEPTDEAWVDEFYTTAIGETFIVDGERQYITYPVGKSVTDDTVINFIQNLIAYATPAIQNVDTRFPYDSVTSIVIGLFEPNDMWVDYIFPRMYAYKRIYLDMNDYTFKETDFINLEDTYTKAQIDAKISGASGAIDKIQVNGVDQPITNKTVNISVPDGFDGIITLSPSITCDITSSKFTSGYYKVSGNGTIKFNNFYASYTVSDGTLLLDTASNYFEYNGFNYASSKKTSPVKVYGYRNTNKTVKLDYLYGMNGSSVSGDYVAQNIVSYGSMPSSDSSDSTYYLLGSRGYDFSGTQNKQGIAKYSDSIKIVNGNLLQNGSAYYPTSSNITTTSSQVFRSSGTYNKGTWEDVDTTPTDNSTKLITSGGVKSAISEKANLTGGNTFSDNQQFDGLVYLEGSTPFFLSKKGKIGMRATNDSNENLGQMNISNAWYDSDHYGAQMSARFKDDDGTYKYNAIRVSHNGPQYFDKTDMAHNLATQDWTSSQGYATESFVNSSISTNTAYFKGTFNSTSDLPTTGVTNNDYAFVTETDTSGNTVYKRYKYNSSNSTWEYEYTLNNSSFTNAQWNTINSGLTSSSLDNVLTTTNYSTTLGSVYQPKGTYATTAQLANKVDDFTLSIATSGGVPQADKFITVNYSDCTSEAGVLIKLSMVSGHGNGASYKFLQDAILSVSYTGSVSATYLKYYGASATYDSATRQFGDIFWTVDTTNKIVVFYTLLGQYATLKMTPYKRLNSSSKGTIIQHTGTAVKYSSGTKVWGSGGNIALVNSIPTKTSQLTNDNGYVTSSSNITGSSYGVADLGNREATIGIQWAGNWVTTDGGGIPVHQSDGNLRPMQWETVKTKLGVSTFELDGDTLNITN